MEYPLLLEFLDTRLEAAFKRERFNRQTIHLYRCSDSWLTLEYSACLLEERSIIRTRTVDFSPEGRKPCYDGGSSGLFYKENSGGA